MLQYSVAELLHRIDRPLYYGGMLVLLLAGLLLFNTYWGDPAIYLPYAQNIARGDFFSYNPGEFSSGSTSPLWAIILSIPFILGAGAVGAKALSLLCTLAAYMAVVRATRIMVGGRSGASVAGFYLVEMLALFGLMMYESPLAVLLIAMGIIAGERVVRGWREGNSITVKALLPLVLVWSLLPLARPDAVVLVPLQILALWLGASRNGRVLAMLIVGAVIAAVPSAMYFGYSLNVLGTISVSSKCRAFALHEQARQVGPVFFSMDALEYLAMIVYVLVIAALGLDCFQREAKRNWFVYYALGVLVVYPFLLVFISPVTNDLPRYFLPMAPVLVIAVARLLKEWGGAQVKTWRFAALALALLFIIKPVASVLGQALEQRGRGYTFEEVMEKEVVDIINDRAKPGEMVLAYEVQLRYFLRDDLTLLSLDGITDGKVAPYLESADMAAFMKQYRPAYWVADGAVDYRPYLQKSMLHTVIEKFRGDRTLEEFTIEGIQFQLVATRKRPVPKSFAGWTHLFVVRYPR